MSLAFLAASATSFLTNSVEQPNILLFFPDEFRYDWGPLGYYNTTDLPLFTPNFQQLAETGVRFTRAFVGAPVCAPSRACLASGRQYDQNTVPENFHNDFDPTVTTFYKVLRDVGGYHTMVTGRDDLDKSSGGPGDDGSKHSIELGFSDQIRCDGSTDVTRGGQPHEPFGFWLKSQPVPNASIAKRYNVSDLFELQAARFAELGKKRPGDRDGPFGSYAIPDPMPLPDAAYQDNWIGNSALTLLKRRPLTKPFFLLASHQAPHPPMDITKSMMESNGLRSRMFPQPVLNTPIPPSEVMMGRQNYAAKIERLDYWLGQYKALLAEQGALNSTIICLCSDHGEMLFDRGVTAKSKPWSSASSVPLVCSGPQLSRGVTSTDAVSTVDLAPTFLDFAGVLNHAPPNMSTMSLKNVLTSASSAPMRKIVHFGLDNFRGVVETINVTHTLKFFCCNGGCPGSTPADRAGFSNSQDEYHLYNIVSNRFELPPLDLRKAYPELVAKYAGMLPSPHQTPANPNSSIPAQGHGYTWQGCHLQG